MSQKNRKPRVPDGWIAVWDDEYSEWFYVNRKTRKSQWEAPEDTIFPPDENPPPKYQPSSGDRNQTRSVETDASAQLQQQQIQLQQQQLQQQQQQIQQQQQLLQQQQLNQNKTTHTETVYTSRHGSGMGSALGGMMVGSMLARSRMRRMGPQVVVVGGGGATGGRLGGGRRRR